MVEATAVLVRVEDWRWCEDLMVGRHFIIVTILLICASPRTVAAAQGRALLGTEKEEDETDCRCLMPVAECLRTGLPVHD